MLAPQLEQNLAPSGRSVPQRSQVGSGIRVCRAPSHSSVSIASGGASSHGLTFTVLVPLAPPGALALIVAVPAPTAVTRPLWLTVATAGLLLAQVNVTPLMALLLASVAVALSCLVAPGDMLGPKLGVTETVAPRKPRRIVPPRPTANTSPWGAPQRPNSVLPVGLLTLLHAVPS